MSQLRLARVPVENDPPDMVAWAEFYLRKATGTHIEPLARKYLEFVTAKARSVNS